jgi:hypothetical protein
MFVVDSDLVGTRPHVVAEIYGMAANKASIESLVTYAVQQELIPSHPALSRVFVDIDP